MDDTVQQVDQSGPEHIVRLWQTKHGIGAESRAGFAAFVLERFGYVAPGAMQKLWDEAITTVKED